jgi:hypothetical protein
MPNYTANFRTEAAIASHEIKARTPEQALQRARKIWETNPDQLVFESYDASQPVVEEIEIESDEEGTELAVWRSDDLRLRQAAPELLYALMNALDVMETQNVGNGGSQALARAAIAKAVQS